MKNLSHLSNIHEAAQELHRLLLGSPWYINVQVVSQPPDAGPTTDKRERQDIVVFVRDAEKLTGGMNNFRSWPVRYELGT